MKNSLLIFILLIFSCQKKSVTNGYLVNGVIKDMPDSTKVMMYFDKDSIMGVTDIINERFQFKGSIKRPRRVMLRIESTRDQKMFWLENHKIDIDGEKGGFVNSKVSGSKTQKEADILKERKDSIHREMSKVNSMVTDSNRDSLFVIYNRMIDEEVEINKKFIRDYPDSYESLTVLNVGTKEKIGAAETNKLFHMLSETLQETEEGKSIKDFVEINKNPIVGGEFIDFKQMNDKGQWIQLSEIKGKYTLLEFWASWCGPCRAFNPELVELYQMYKDKGFVILSISLDTNKDKWIRAIEDDGLVWDNVSDLNGGDNRAAKIYGVRDIPDNFLIDENGVVIARYLRGNDLKQKLKSLFE
ncbi:TlpA disulfide reductase family protein [Snuella sedimenti]|uniref:AhpC/TSA family protein n=1 Tax=Snuella sedimenti TaxID=2798802 RepID=A0A8J7J5T6_9FLAO|nr:TlpA disulfide reductase family protein [Snuella sedimenti]MBJ6369353.1 AhpC/TSA family protein [Snuella sedimenti]